ncbi:MAG: phosphodiesterase [Rhodobacteraceae bacterium]|nr:phosphodiesterase [Paracoccaceae bacterium]
MIPLPTPFLTIPIAHRALHDMDAGRPENSPAAIRAAVKAGFGIEIDLQLSNDGQAMVFHDYQLDRLTGEKGPVRMRSAAELQNIPLAGSAAREKIPTLQEVLGLVAGKVPVLLEIKDQDGALGPETGILEQATAKALEGYDGPVAVMSFNPHAIAAFAIHAPHVPRGLVTGAFARENWLLVPKKRLEELRTIPDFERVGASFISHRADDLTSPHLAAIKARGVPILCWTIRSSEEELRARQVADNITFEGYQPV